MSLPSAAPVPLPESMQIPNIRPVKVSILYTAGLAAVALAMVLLPVIYVALIGIVIFLTVAFATGPGLSILVSGGGFFRILAYGTPIVAGGITVFFMVKPLFAKAAQQDVEPETLREEDEPRLFAFVRDVATAVGAPVPSEIRVHNDVNASASFRRGWRSFFANDLVLTIGLPLARGLRTDQFAGVLAHEFGHFSQGAGMRFSYAIRSVNNWFARVVYERDDWDEMLAERRSSGDFRLRIVFAIASAAVWIGRKILWVLMWTAHLLSCFLSRQMEYDADLHEIRLTGSKTFAATQRALPELQSARHEAFEDLARMSRLGTLMVDFPQLIGHVFDRMNPEWRGAIRRAQEETKGKLWDTHPTDAARILRAETEADPGVFWSADPATGLFRDFPGLSERFTTRWLQERYGVDPQDFRVLDYPAYAAEQAIEELQHGLGRRYFEGALNLFHPLQLPSDSSPWTAAAEAELRDLLAGWSSRAGSLLELHHAEETDKIRQEYELIRSERLLLKTSLAAKSKRYGDEAARSPEAALARQQSDLADAERSIRDEQSTQTAINEIYEKRTSLGLCLLRHLAEDGGTLQFVTFDEPPVRHEKPLVEVLARIEALLPMLNAFGAIASVVREARGLRHQVAALADALPHGASLATPDQREMEEVGYALERCLVEMRKGLKGIPYPFPAEQQAATVAEVIVGEIPDGNSFGMILEFSRQVECRLDEAYFRAMLEIGAVLFSMEQHLAETDGAPAESGGMLPDADPTNRADEGAI